MIPNDIGGWLGRVFDSAGEVDCTSSINVQFWTPNHFRHRLCNSKVVTNNHYNKLSPVCTETLPNLSPPDLPGLLRSMSHFHMRSHFSSLFLSYFLSLESQLQPKSIHVLPRIRKIRHRPSCVAIYASHFSSESQL